MRKLAAPLRLTWDWSWPPIVQAGSVPSRPAPGIVRAIGAEIVRARVLMLEVGYPEPEALLSGELAAALAGFEGSLSLVLAPPAAAALAAAKPWEALGAGEVWLDATPGRGPVPASLEAWPAVRFSLTAGNLAQVAAGIERAASRGAAAISLPNLPLFGDILRGAEAVTPRAAQLAALAGRIAAAVRDRPGIDLRIHSYGLWQALRAAGVRLEGEHPPGEGCQAGSAIGYIDPAGILYPCASLPVPLARVEAGVLGRAWASADIAALRSAIAGLPTACVGCLIEQSCRGGCRGWAHYLSGSWDAVGPDCARA